MDDEIPQEGYESLKILIESLKTQNLDDERDEWGSFTDDQVEDDDDIEVYTGFNV